MKWKTRNGFAVKQSSSAWNKIDNTTKAGLHPYFDGHSKIGQILIGRERVPQKEKAMPFSPSQSTSDMVKFGSQSLRQMSSIDL